MRSIVAVMLGLYRLVSRVRARQIHGGEASSHVLKVAGGLALQPLSTTESVSSVAGMSRGWTWTPSGTPHRGARRPRHRWTARMSF